jgi:cytidine deaminase
VILPTPSGLRSVPVTDLLPLAYVATTASRLPFAAEYLEPVRAGRKVATIRFGESARLGPTDLVFETSPEVVLPAEVTSLVRKRLGDVTLEEAVAARSADLAQMRQRMPGHYPGITAEDEVTVVRFRLT